MAIWELFGLTYGSPLNPVMTVCLGLSGKLPTAEALVMMAAEFAAHLFGVFVVRNIAMYAFEAHANGSFLPPRPHAGVSQMLAVFIEAGLTGTVCLVALSLDHIFPKSASVKRWFFITLFVIVGISVGGNWTGGVMNPAISFALALHEGTWTAHGVYWAGPLSGGIAAAALYTNVVRYHSTALKGIKSKRAAPRSAMARLKHQ